MPSEKLVKDFMRPLTQYYNVREEDTVQQALKLMSKAREEAKPECLIVVGKDSSEKDVIKGFVAIPELVFGLTSRFLRGAQSSGPIFWEGQCAAECLEGMKKRVGEIMVPIKACMVETEMLMEAVFLLNKYQVDFLPVVTRDRDEVVGIVHLGNIFKEISRISGAGSEKIVAKEEVFV